MNICRKGYIVSLVLLCACTIFNIYKNSAPLSCAILPALFVVVLSFIQMKQFVFRRSTLLLFGFASVIIVSTIVSGEVELKSDAVTLLLLCFLYICATSVVLKPEEAFCFVACYYVIATVVSINIVLNWLTGNYYSEWFQRSSFIFLGVYKDPNYVSSFTAPAIIAMYLFRDEIKGKIKKYILCVCSIIILCGLLCAQSRAALFSITVAALILCFDKEKRRPIRIVALALLVFIGYSLMSVLMSLLPGQISSRFTNVVETDTRLLLWGSAFQQFLKNPIIGSGLNSASSASIESMGNYSHSNYIDILTGGGILGLLLFVLFYYFRIIKNKRKEPLVKAAATIAFMAPLAFINGLTTLSFFSPLIVITIVMDTAIGNT